MGGEAVIIGSIIPVVGTNMGCSWSNANSGSSSMTSRLGSTLLWLVLLLCAARAAEPGVPSLIALCDGKFGLCRYVHRQTRQEILPARYEQAFDFSEGLAVVRIDGRFGYIDSRGEIAITPRFDRAGD